MPIKSDSLTAQPLLPKWRIFSIVAAGVFMSTLDSSMVNIALPTIMEEFNSSLRATEWIVLVYLLTITSTLLIWGTLSDRLGRNRIYPLGLIVFAFGSLACAFAPKLSFLIVSRLCQALGAGMMMSTGPAIIKDTFPENQLGRGRGMISVFVSLGLMTGPALGGFLLEYFSWRALFFITVPIGFLFALAGLILIPERDPDQYQKNSPPLSSRWKGPATWILLLISFSLAISYASAPSWSPLVLSALGLTVALALTLFIFHEKKAANPLLPYDLVKNRFFLSALICASLSFLILFFVLILTPFYLSHVLNMPKARIGSIMMTIPLAVLLIGPTAGWLSEKFTAQKLSTLGLLFSSLGVALLAGLSEHSSPSGIIARLAVLGGGQALFLAPNSASILKNVTRQHTGKSASLLATARNLGMLLGIAMASLVFSHKFSQLTGGLDLRDFSAEHTSAFVEAMRQSFFVAALIGVLGVFISWNRDG
nr:MFS transporter [Desulfobulbaceae bacterium]